MKTFGAAYWKGITAVGKLCEYICAFMGMGMVVLVTVQVILRALNMPLFGIEELLTFPTIWLYFLGGACASFTNSHIECGLVGAVCKNPKMVAISKCISNILASALSVYVLKWAWEYSLYSLKMGKISAILHIPMPVGELVMFAGLALMALFTVSETVRGLFLLKENMKEGGAA